MVSFMRNLIKKHPIFFYLIISYGITWLGWIPSLIISSKQGYLLPTLDGFANLIQAGFTDTTHIIMVLSYSFAIYGPLIGALIVTGIIKGSLYKKEIVII